MTARRVVWIIVALMAAAAVYTAWPDRIRSLAELFASTPHEAYAASLKRVGLHGTALGRDWLKAAEQSLARATRVTVSRREMLWFRASEPRATAFTLGLRRGQRLVVEAQLESNLPARAFLDIFERRGNELRHVANAPADRLAVTVNIRRDGEYVTRVQVELLRDARVTFIQRVEPTLRIPVQSATVSSIQSGFGAPRNQGRRTHHGVDIFARRGTPVVAAAGGIVSSVGTNTLGGKVVWVFVPATRETHYYAHLDSQLITAGTSVDAGEVVGTVGNTGNARYGPPHLHFGIYSLGGPVDPLPYVKPALSPQPIRASTAGLGELARLRVPQDIAAADLAGGAVQRRAAGTIVRVVGASDRRHRVRLPDGVEAYVSDTAVEPVRTPLQVFRPRRDMPLFASPEDGLVMDTVDAAARLEILGTFDNALLVRTEDDVTGWIRSEVLRTDKRQ